MRKLICVMFIMVLLISCSDENQISDTRLINLSYKDTSVFSSNSNEVIIPKIESDYVLLENIYSSKTKTIQCDYKFEYDIPPIVVVHPDGYLIGSFKRVKSSARNSMRMPVVVLIDENGKIIWEEIYKHSYSVGNMSNLIVYDDGRFLFTLSNWPESSMGTPRSVASKLIQCNSKGKVNWIKEFDDTIGSVLKFVFLTENEEIIIAGETQSSIRNIDIGFLKLNEDGKELTKVQYGGMSNEYLKNCKYSPGLGLVFTGWTNSSDGEFFKESRDVKWQDYVAFVNMDLDIKWINHIESYERFSYDQLEVNDDKIYLIGNSLINKEQEDSLENKQLFIVKYGITGKEVYKTYCPEHQSYQGVMSVDSYHNVVVGSGYANKGVLSFYDKQGKKSQKSMDVTYVPKEIWSRKNGGFIIKSIREIASIPQPAFSSSMLFDHDVVIEEYDEKKILMWRKVFNNYSDLRIDFVEVFIN